MKKLHITLIIFGIIFCTARFSYGQAPPNDNCANATLILSGATCTTGLEPNGTIQAGEIKPSCGAGSNNNNKSVWYKFVADSTSMYVQMYLTGILNGTTYNEPRWALEAYNTATCLPGNAQHFIPNQCTHAALVGDSDNIMELNLSTLVVGNTYLLQVYYQPGNGAPTPQFCISVGKAYSRPCNICTAPCGAACQFTYTPTIPQVKSSCTARKQLPYLEGGVSNSRCYTFTATDVVMDFDVATKNKCTTTSPAFPISYTLYTSSCGLLQAGSGNSGTVKMLPGLTVGQSYTICYTITSDSDCYITTYYPYVYPSILLPIELTSFYGSLQNGTVVLNWSTESELNNDYFSPEHSTDGLHFNEIARITGAGTSSHILNYSYTDNSPASGINYYRLVQYDFDGTPHYSDVISVDVNAPLTAVSIIPNPVINNGNLLSVVSDADRQVTISIFDAIGKLTLTQTKTLHAGKNVFDIDFTNLPLGIYNLMLLTSDGNKGITFIK